MSRQARVECRVPPSFDGPVFDRAGAGRGEEERFEEDALGALGEDYGGGPCVSEGGRYAGVVVWWRGEGGREVWRGRNGGHSGGGSFGEDVKSLCRLRGNSAIEIEAY